MAANDFSQFHELAEQFKGEIPLKQLCEQEGVSYRAYIAWRSRNGISPRRHRRKSNPPQGLLEVEAMDVPGVSPKAISVHIEFENGLKFDRDEMDVDMLVEFLTKIRSAICLG